MPTYQVQVLLSRLATFHVEAASPDEAARAVRADAPGVRAQQDIDPDLRLDYVVNVRAL